MRICNIRLCKICWCIGIPRNTWRLSLFRYETFINFFFWLLVFFDTRRERHTHTIFAMLTVSTDPTTRGASCRPNWTGLAKAQKSTRFVQRQISTHSSSFKSQLPAFLKKSPKILSPSLPGMTSFTSPVSFAIRGFYYDVCDCYIPCARARTAALNVCIYPCTKLNSSKPNQTER